MQASWLRGTHGHPFVLPYRLGTALTQPPCPPRLEPHSAPLLPSSFQAGGSSLLTASADPASLLAAATGVRQPLLPLSLNLGHQHYSAAPPAQASCYSLGL